MSPKILTFDIETSPHLGWFFGLFKQNIGINQIKEPTRVISFSAKWYGSKNVMFFSEYHCAGGQEEMVRKAHSLMSQADILVGFNNKAFDTPHLNREFNKLGLAPPAPSQEVDLYLVAKRRFNFASNKLAYITQYLGLSGKLPNQGFDLWLKCLQGDPRAWGEMRRYNKRDVVTTEELYTKWLAWIPSHPHVGLYSERPGDCGVCGSDDVTWQGYATTKLGKFKRFQCKACGTWGRAKRAEGYAEGRPVT